MNVNKNHIREIAVTCSKYTRPFRGREGYLAGKAKKGSKKSATAKECSLQASSIMYF